METIHRAEQLSFENCVEILDSEPSDSKRVAFAQQRLKALVGVACATLVRQAASGGEAGADAARFLKLLMQEIGK